MAERMRRIETGELQVVGVNCFAETAPSPLGGEGIILRVDPAAEAELRDDVHDWRQSRDRVPEAQPSAGNVHDPEFPRARHREGCRRADGARCFV